MLFSYDSEPNPGPALIQYIEELSPTSVVPLALLYFTILNIALLLKVYKPVSLCVDFPFNPK